MTDHIGELDLDQRQRQRAMVQIAAIEAEIEDEPDQALVNQAAGTLRNITEGAIGSLLATAVQPGVWQWIHQLLAGFGKP
jgi:hypothetical protein